MAARGSGRGGRVVQYVLSAVIASSIACATGASDGVDTTSSNTVEAPDAATSGVRLPPPSSTTPTSDASLPVPDGGCVAPAISCGAACVDTTNDAANCGACAKACASGDICSGGACATPCGGSLLRCGAQCVDTQSTMAHCGGCGMACPAQTNACAAGTCLVNLTVRAYIDGQSILVIQGVSLKWHHVRDAGPGLWLEQNYETVVNGGAWYPSWPSSGENRSCNCDSSSLSIAPLAARATTATVTKTSGRGTITIVEQPTAANGFALKISYDDPLGGADWYEALIVYATR